MAKLPSFQFYPGDWMKDPALRSVSAGARGLWMDLLCLMFECPVRGVLARVSGEPWKSRDIARATGVPLRSVERYVSELAAADVLSFNIKDAITSRRIMRDHDQRLASNLRQSRFRDNKDLSQESNARVTVDVTRMSHDSSSSSSSTSSLRSEVPPTKPPKSERSPLWGTNKFFRCSDVEMKSAEDWYLKNHITLAVRDAVLEACENWLADGTSATARAARANPTHFRRLMNREWVTRIQATIGGASRANGAVPHRPPGLQVLDREMERERERERNPAIPEHPQSILALLSDRGVKS